jgi:hypothetical protein
METLELTLTLPVSSDRHIHLEDIVLPDTWTARQVNVVCTVKRADAPPTTKPSPIDECLTRHELPGRRLTNEELIAMGFEPEPTLEECVAEAKRKRDYRLAHPEDHSFEDLFGCLYDGKRTHEQILADAVAEQREIRDEWPD